VDILVHNGHLKEGIILCNIIVNPAIMFTFSTNTSIDKIAVFNFKSVTTLIQMYSKHVDCYFVKEL